MNQQTTDQRNKDDQCNGVTDRNKSHVLNKVPEENNHHDDIDGSDLELSQSEIRIGKSS